MGAAFKLDPVTFNKHIEDYVFKKKLSYVEAVLESCTDFNVEPDSISNILSAPIKERLEVEGQELNIIPRKNKLPI
jgi:hypothetical protein